MIDFEKKIYNSDKFRLAALFFQRNNTYCLYPPGTTEYVKYWELETERCLNGYVAEDGDYISGYNYFYINYSPILRIVESSIVIYGTPRLKRSRTLEFPDFYDYDYYYFTACQEAEDTGKFMCVLKSRRKGYSYKAAAMAVRNYMLIAESKSYVYASGDLYLIKDGILTKAWDLIDWLNTNTAWAKKASISTKMLRRASFYITDSLGNKVEAGYKSEITGVTIKADPDKTRGKAGKLILFEEAGSNSVLKDAWNTARPSVEQDGIAFGLMIAFGTSGSSSVGFSGLREMFYNPKSFNCLEFPNIWEGSAYTNTTCGFFIPLYTNLDVKDKTGKPLYMDVDGNTNTIKALLYVLKLREPIIESASSSTIVDRYIAENCVTPSEACITLSGNIFPKKELQLLLAMIRTNKKLLAHKQVGDLTFVNGELLWVLKKIGDITKYPIGKNDDPTGSIVIWEHPVLNAPHGLYIAGCDPFDHDLSGTNSLGSTIIYKRFLNFEEYSDIIVAEYTGRPATAEEYYENVRKLLLYYNARLLYENERKGIFPYFTLKHCDYLLLDQPDIINDIIKDSKVLRRKGIHMTKLIKDYGEGLIKEWLNEEYAPGKKNLTRILSEPLLEELILANGVLNVDREIALIMVMIYRELIHNTKVKQVEECVRKQRLFDKPLFSTEWFDDSNETNNSSLFTF